MYFLDEDNNLIENCPKCGADFSPEKGTNCLLTCPAKQLEIKHEKLVSKMIAHCLPKEKITFVSPKTTPIISDKWRWGWTDEVEPMMLNK